MRPLSTICSMAPFDPTFMAPHNDDWMLHMMAAVNKVTSTKTQLPYAYYDLPFCMPKRPKEASENLGEVRCVVR